MTTGNAYFSRHPVLSQMFQCWDESLKDVSCLWALKFGHKPVTTFKKIYVLCIAQFVPEKGDLVRKLINRLGSCSNSSWRCIWLYLACNSHPENFLRNTSSTLCLRVHSHVMYSTKNSKWSNVHIKKDKALLTRAPILTQMNMHYKHAYLCSFSFQIDILGTLHFLFLKQVPLKLWKRSWRCWIDHWFGFIDTEFRLSSSKMQSSFPVIKILMTFFSVWSSPILLYTEQKKKGIWNLVLNYAFFFWI